MGVIKLPKNSINFFKDNQDKIFESGNLSEGPWNEQLSKKIKSITKTKNAISVNSNGSGLVSLLLIYKVYYGRTDIMIQSNSMYGLKTITNDYQSYSKGAERNIIDLKYGNLSVKIFSFGIITCLIRAL